MNIILDTLMFGGKMLYYILESSAYMVIPKGKKDVTGEIVLITGAGSGIGRLMAIKFASLGAILVLWDIDEEGNMETCRLAKQKGGEKVFAYKCDCSNRQEIYKVADQVKEEVGDVTLLINNAGVVTGKLFLDIPDDMVERSFLVNVLAHFWTCKAFLPAMIKANHGHLVCIASIAGQVGISRLSEYCSSKHAAVGFAESLFFELKQAYKSKIKTTIICPSFIKTRMFHGVKTKYSFLLPMLEQEYVAQKIINAILEEQLYLMMPRFVSFGLFLKQIVSPNMMMAIAEYLGFDSSMASFRGKKKANEVSTEAEKEH